MFASTPPLREKHKQYKILNREDEIKTYRKIIEDLLSLEEGNIEDGGEEIHELEYEDF